MLICYKEDLKSDSIRLELINNDRIEDFWMATNDVQVVRNITLDIPFPLKQARMYTNYLLREYYRGNFLPLQIIDNKDNSFIGHIFLFGLDFKEGICPYGL